MSATACFFVNSMRDEAHELARGLRRRDPELLDRLIEQYHYRLFRYLLYLTGNRETAEDLFQDTWLRVLDRGHQYDGRSKFEAWLFSIARHLVIDRLRRRRDPVSLDDLGSPEDPRSAAQVPASEISPVDSLSLQETAAQVRLALGRLTSAYREVLLLRFQEELTIEEIAAVVEAPLSTVKSRLYRGLEEMRKLLEGERS